IEAAGLIWSVFYLIRRALKHHHVKALLVLVVSAAGALLVTMNMDTTSDWAYVFWALVAAAIIAAAKIPPS
ncbi:MAG: hypothetical protein ACRDOH_13705, partial [Streptosporangiaceae bacterium]